MDEQVPSDACKLYLDATACFEAGDYDSAIKKFVNALALHPDYAEHYIYNGEHWKGSSRFTEAVVWFTAAAESEDSDQVLAASATLGNCLHSLGRLEEAIEAYSNCLRYSDEAHYYDERGRVYLHAHRYREAIADLSSAIERELDELKWYYTRNKHRMQELYRNRGDEYAALEDSQAIDYYIKAILLDSTDFDTWLCRGDDKYSLQELYRNRGDAYAALEEHSQAIADYSEALRLDPTRSDTWLCRANEYFNSRDYNLALHDVSKLIKSNPNFIEAYRFRATVFRRIGSDREAASDLAQASLLEVQ